MFKLDLENEEEPESKLPTSIGGLVAKSSLTLVTPWTVACLAPLSMGFSRQEYWSGLPFTSPGDLPEPGIEPRSPALQADALPSELPGKPAPPGKFLSLFFKRDHSGSERLGRQLRFPKWESSPDIHTQVHLIPRP